MSSPLSRFFTGVGVKRLSQVEVDGKLSNQHEFNGIAGFKRIFGGERKKFNARFIFIADEEDKLREESGFVTWYDARENHPTRSEYRLYYSTNGIIQSAQAEDLIVVAVINESDLAVIVAPRLSTAEKQLLWLFGLEEAEREFIVRDLTGEKKDIGFAGKYIVSSLGFEIEETAPDFLEKILEKFGKAFPVTKEFSEFARSTVQDVSPVEAPDETLLIWLEREELLFKTLEKVIIQERLEEGFGADVEEFIKFSLRVQNRRKSRAGFSFEHNLAEIFKANKIRYSHGAITERNNKPDFVFPGIEFYHAPCFNTSLLSMLGLKTTAKDRWRQVLSEAAKIPHKHLITLEPAISRNQTEEMRANNLQLVIPSPLFSTYTSEQQKYLISLRDFIKLVDDKQKTI